MTRRLTLVIVGTVAATLLFAGLGTLLLAQFGAKRETENELRRQATDIASSIENAEDKAQLRVLVNLRRALDVEGIAVIRFGPAGRNLDPFPTGVNEADLNLAALQAGKSITGSHGSLVYSAAPAAGVKVNSGQLVLPVVVLTRQVDSILRPAVGWFVLTAIITLAIGALVAWRFGRRLTRPVREAHEATRRKGLRYGASQIAGGACHHDGALRVRHLSLFALLVDRIDQLHGRCARAIEGRRAPVLVVGQS